jgi:hypothetical protein
MHAWKLGLIGLLVGGSLSFAAPDAPQSIEIAVGTPVALKLAMRVTMAVCDDPSLVRVETAPDDSSLQLVGLEVGTTLCSFFESALTNRLVLEVHVVPAPESGALRSLRAGSDADRAAVLRR